MRQQLHYLSLVTLFHLCAGAAFAQNTITTQALSIASICPGSTLDVPFTASGTYQSGNVFTVQLSNGSEYVNIPTGGASFNNSTGRYTVTATIPASTAAGTTYRVRVTASNPAVIGTPSSTQFSVKIKPGVPVVTPLQVMCQGTTANQMALNTSVSVQTTQGATARIYNSDGGVAGFSFSNTSGNITYFTKSLSAFGYSSTYKYPVNETTYYATQTLDGCESDKIPTTVRILYADLYGPSATTMLGTGVGRLEYCQGETALPLNVKGIQPAPDYYRIVYKGPEVGATYSPVALTPSTANAGQSNYFLKYEPIDNTKVCAPYGINPAAELNLFVRINARPARPSLPNSTLTYCQNQTANLLTANTTETGASVLWYTTATGGTATTSAPRPSTTQAGTFKYYAAQVLNSCEGDRAEITVEVKAASPNPTATNATYCVGQQAVPLSAVASSGGSLLWYAAASGGTGTQAAPTPTTGNASTQTYYVAQTVGSNCESQRVPVTVTVNGLPPAPFISTAVTTFCQNSAGSPLSAIGQNLRWYDVPTGGFGNTSQIPNTSTAGVKNYYVSQTVNSCEGPRSSVAVTILEAPVAPIVTQTSYEFCQGTTGTISGNVNTNISTNWYIYGTSPGFVNRYQSGNTTYAVVATDQPRTMTYSIFQTSASGCVGPASSLINVTVKATPVAPTTQAIAVCQGVAAPTVQAIGQSLLWYDASSGGTGSSATPVITTAQPSQKIYYVSQTQNGCESPRAALSASVNAIPAAPSVGNGPVHCQNAQVGALSATGQNLRWYTEATGGTSQASVTPKTDTPGTFVYYASQSVANCEGPRSSLSVKINAIPATPSTTNTLSFCQKTATEPLKADGANIKWYDSKGSLTNAPTPSSDAPGQVSYFVTQTVDGCESSRAEIKVTTKRTPDAPGTLARTICQNDAAPVLNAAGQGLKWYTANTGGDGNSTAPVVNAGQSGQTTYYVSQSLDGCEGPRAALLVTVKALPAAPDVTKKDLCQFANSTPLTATGSGLTWYDPDGKVIGNTGPTPVTDRGATFAYQVSQTADGCVGPKATLTVTIMTTPLPVLAKSVLELCRGSNAAPLEATGTGLKWTDPTGVTSTTAPVPFTTEPTKNPDGDAYYVTQTGANGCESPRALIRVFVQGPPTLALTGATTVNLGVEAPISLKFTGVGPYRYTISAGASLSLAGSAVKDTTILVLPTRTTVYQVLEVSNRCGVGLPASTATVVVTVPTIQTQFLASATACAGTTLSANFLTTGQFNPGSAFRLQLARTDADTTKILYADLPNMQVTGGQISASIPATATAGTYLVRVMATNPKIPILGAPSATTLTIRQLPGASLTASQTTIYEGEAVKLSVGFTGDGPWTFVYRDSSSVGNLTREILTNANPHVLDLRPQKPTTYRLTALSNGCGTSLSLPASVSVMVNPLLAVEPLAGLVRVFPVPVVSVVTVEIDPSLLTGPATLMLVNEKGNVVQKQATRQSTTQLNLAEQPAGVYILQVRVGDQLVNRRLLKQ